MGPSADCFIGTMFALVMSFVDNDVWTVQCRGELVLVEEGDIGLGTRTLVVLVVNELDSLKFGCHGVWRSVFPFRRTSFGRAGGPTYDLHKGKRM